MSVRNEINVFSCFSYGNAATRRLFVVTLSPREFFAELSPPMNIAVLYRAVSRRIARR
jgi:hypothetical protein